MTNELDLQLHTFQNIIRRYIIRLDHRGISSRDLQEEVQVDLLLLLLRVAVGRELLTYSLDLSADVFQRAGDGYWRISPITS